MLKVKRIIEQSGRSLESLSRACAISISRFTEALSDNSWSLVEISQIAKVLNLSLEDLLLESVDDSRVEFAFRSSIPVCDDSVPFFELERLRKYVHSAFMMLGEESISPLLPGNLADSPEELAIKFRAMYFPDNPIGPIIDLPARCSDKLGYLLYTINSSYIDGASAVIEKRPFIFVSRRFSGRMLFTLAHEIGHICRARNNCADSFYIDKDVHKARGDEEVFANRFASSLLMPEKGVIATLQAFRDRSGIRGQLGDIEIIVLSHMFGVSFEAAGLRCESLELLPRGGTDALNFQLKKQHSSAEMRVRDVGLPERIDVDFPIVSPVLLNSALKRVRSGEMSMGEAVAILGIGARDMFLAEGACH